MAQLVDSTRPSLQSLRDAPRASGIVLCTAALATVTLVTAATWWPQHPIVAGFQAVLGVVLASLTWMSLRAAVQTEAQTRAAERAARAFEASEAHNRALQSSQARLISFIEHMPAAVAMFDRDLRYLAVSRRWKDDYRLGDRDLTGLHHYEVFPEITQLPEWRAVHQRCLAGAIERCEDDHFVRMDGRDEWLQWEVRPWYDAQGDIGGIMMLTEVITARKLAAQALAESQQRLERALEEKEVLLREIHHRVKNNLAVISSMFSLQSAATRDQPTLDLLEDGRSRIRSMALLHELLYRSDNLAAIDFAEYAVALARDLIRSQTRTTRVDLVTRIEPVTLAVDVAIPVGLVLNEMLTNAMKHAFQGRDAGRIELELHRCGLRCVMDVADDGVGLRTPDLANQDAIGMRVMRALARQLEGELEIASREQGTRARLIFKP